MEKLYSPESRVREGLRLTVDDYVLARNAFHILGRFDPFWRHCDRKSECIDWRFDYVTRQESVFGN